MARRILRGCIQALAPIEVADTFAAANADEELQWAGVRTSLSPRALPHVRMPLQQAG